MNRQVGASSHQEKVSSDEADHCADHCCHQVQSKRDRDQQEASVKDPSRALVWWLQRRRARGLTGCWLRVKRCLNGVQPFPNLNVVVAAYVPQHETAKPGAFDAQCHIRQCPAARGANLEICNSRVSKARALRSKSFQRFSRDCPSNGFGHHCTGAIQYLCW